MAVYKSIFISLLRRALTEFNADNIQTVTILSLGKRDFLVIYYVSSSPTLGDMKCMKNIQKFIQDSDCDAVLHLRSQWRKMNGMHSFASSEEVIYSKPIYVPVRFVPSGLYNYR